MKPWRELVIPHRDVLEGTFQQAEFAADITAVHQGRAQREYQDASAFYARTFITEGMAILLMQVLTRLIGRGGEPVIQLQTAFGGGKTHSMLAVYHLAGRHCALSDLSGIPALLDRAGVVDLPQARIAVIDGTAHAPGQPWMHGKQRVHTLWGELAWQLGGTDGYAQLAEADTTGTSPGKNVLRALIEAAAPCVILIDELVAYLRQFTEGQAISGGTYDSNLSFVQALTEAVKAVPTAVLLASLPESEIEAGSQRGAAALRALEHVFGRVQALWKPVATDEAFEIVRRRLFEPVRDESARAAVCRAFADAYTAEGARLPGETQEQRYYERLLQAYPIHPEVFDRLFSDWTTIDGFQRTRGVLKLMAKVIYRLWSEDNRDLLILPGSLPLDDPHSRNELTYYLPPGWDAVIETDIDGERAAATRIEHHEPRFGQFGAARRVARTLFLGSAPASVVQNDASRGLDRARLLLGCLQPGQAASIYADALGRVIDQARYLRTTGDPAAAETRYWFDTRANLRREMEDRKRRFDDQTEVRDTLASTLKKLLAQPAPFDGLHLFTPHADVPDDSALRLVVLGPEHWTSRDEGRPARDAVRTYLKQHGDKPRYRANRLLFLAPDHGPLSRLKEAARTVLAWSSIVADIKEGRLNIDLLQQREAETALKSAQDVLPSTARECYKWLLGPLQENPTDPEPEIEAFPVPTSSAAIGKEIARICQENELIIETWSPIHLRAALKRLYWRDGDTSTRAGQFFEDSLRYFYLPRLKNHAVFAQAITAGASSKDFFGFAYGLKADGGYEGFCFGHCNPVIDDSLLLIEPDAAAAYAASLQQPGLPLPLGRGADAPSGGGSPGVRDDPNHPVPGSTASIAPPPDDPPPTKPVAPRHFHGSADIPAASAKMHLLQLAEEVISQLCTDPNASVRVVLEISAEFPDGAGESTKRAVSENAKTLGMKMAEWE